MPITAAEYRVATGKHQHTLERNNTPVLPESSEKNRWHARENPVGEEIHQLASTLLNSANVTLPFMPARRLRLNSLQKGLMLGLVLSQIRPAEAGTLTALAPPGSTGEPRPLLPAFVDGSDAETAPLAARLAPVPQPAEWDRDQAMLIIRDDNMKQRLAQALLPLLHSPDAQSEETTEALQDWLQQQLARGNVVVAPALAADNGEAHPRAKRESQAAHEQRIKNHILSHCAFETEILDAEGKDAGTVLMYHAQNAENPFRAIYTGHPHTAPAPWERGVAQGLDFSFGVLTFGLWDLAGELIASRLRKARYKEQDDAICSARQDRLALGQLATAIEQDTLEWHTASRLRQSGRRSLELVDSLPHQDRAAWYARNPLTGVQRELLFKLNGKQAIDGSGREVLLKPTANGDYVTWHPDAMVPQRLERRVVVDSQSRSWRYADDFDTGPLNVELVEGKNLVIVQGGKYELHMNKAREYEIVVHKSRAAPAVTEYHPVYMEPLSRSWHLKAHNNAPVFNPQQQRIIQRTQVALEADKQYRLVNNLNPASYGSGKIVEVRNNGKSLYETAPLYYAVEINGNLVPVTVEVTPGHGVAYKIHSVNGARPESYGVEWDGHRWLFEKPTSVQVSDKLKKALSKVEYETPDFARTLSAPDRYGLRWGNDERAWIKVEGRYIRVRVLPDERFLIRRERGSQGLYLRSHRGQLVPETAAERLSYIMHVGLNGKGKRTAQEILNKQDGFTPQMSDALLRLYDFPDGAFYNAENFALHIEQHGELPAWAAQFRKTDVNRGHSTTPLENIARQENAVDKLAALPGYDRQRASALLAQYDFSDSSLWDHELFVEFIRSYGDIPFWAASFRKADNSALSPFDPHNPEAVAALVNPETSAEDLLLADTWPMVENLPQPEDLLAQAPGYNRESAAALLADYRFPPDAPYDDYMLVSYIQQYGKLPEWAAGFRNIPAAQPQPPQKVKAAAAPQPEKAASRSLLKPRPVLPGPPRSAAQPAPAAAPQPEKAASRSLLKPRPVLPAPPRSAAQPAPAAAPQPEKAASRSLLKPRPILPAPPRSADQPAAAAVPQPARESYAASQAIRFREQLLRLAHAALARDEPVELTLSRLPGYNMEKAKALLSEYEFPWSAGFYERLMVEYIRDNASVPIWAQQFNKRFPDAYRAEDPLRGMPGHAQVIALKDHYLFLQRNLQALRRLLKVPGYSAERAKTILGRYNFHSQKEMTVEMLVEFIAWFGRPPSWAEKFKHNFAKRMRMATAGEPGSLPDYNAPLVKAQLAHYDFSGSINFNEKMLVNHVWWFGKVPEWASIYKKPTPAEDAAVARDAQRTDAAGSASLQAVPLPSHIIERKARLKRQLHILHSKENPGETEVISTDSSQHLGLNNRLLTIENDHRYILLAYSAGYLKTVDDAAITEHITAFRRYYGPQAAFGYQDEQERWYIKMLHVPGVTLHNLSVGSLPADADQRFMDMVASLEQRGLSVQDIDFCNVVWDAQTERFYPLGIAYEKPQDTAAEPSTARKQTLNARLSTLRKTIARLARNNAATT